MIFYFIELSFIASSGVLLHLVMFLAWYCIMHISGCTVLVHMANELSESAVGKRAGSVGGSSSYSEAEMWERQQEQKVSVTSSDS